ncbi:MAG: hypothetical protein IT434_01935 [Phycisphaerales bacterium]|nr:hypothetical protein [Phycisphaerales bacterium]
MNTQHPRCSQPTPTLAEEAGRGDLPDFPEPVVPHPDGCVFGDIPGVWIPTEECIAALGLALAYSLLLLK